jgi:hypothetical protein
VSAGKTSPRGTPLLSVTTLAKATRLSIRSATELLDEFVLDGLVVDVTHRAKRRLFALCGLTPSAMKSPRPAGHYLAGPPAGRDSIDPR